MWWRQNKHYFPLLARVAQKYLGMPPGSVESEREFSIGGQICCPKRARTLPVAVEQLLFAKCNMDRFADNIHYISNALIHKPTLLLTSVLR